MSRSFRSEQELVSACCLHKPGFGGCSTEAASTPTTSDDFQLVQDKLSHMLADTTGMQLLCMRMDQLQKAGTIGLQHASLAELHPVAGAPVPGGSAMARRCPLQQRDLA